MQPAEEYFNILSDTSTHRNLKGSTVLVRLLPLLLAIVLFAAHIMRFNGYFWPAIILLSATTLWIRRTWVLTMWRILVVIGIFEWVRATIYLVRMRMNTDVPFKRLLLIMGGVILFNIVVVYSLRNKKLKQYYAGDRDTGEAGQA